MNTALSIADNWQKILSALPKDLDLTELARETKAIRRAKNLKDGESLLKLSLWYGPCGISLRAVSAMSCGSDVATLSDVGVLKRLSNAGEWLKSILDKMLSEVSSEIKSFNRNIVLVDATSVRSKLNPDQRYLIHTRYVPGYGFSNFELTGIREGEKLSRHIINQGDIIIADRCYGRGTGFDHVINANADFVLRVGWKSSPLRDENGEKIMLMDKVDGMSEGEVRDIDMHYKSTYGLKKIRIIIVRKPSSASNHERGRVERKAAKNNRELNPMSQSAAGYMFIATSLIRSDYDSKKIVDLYKARWQIELGFKRLKSIINIDKAPAKRHDLLMTWLYAHLVFALIVDKISREIGFFP